MLYLENNPSILDSSSASRAFSFLTCSVSFLTCSVSFLICAFSCFSLLVSASISSVPLKAEFSQESRCSQIERQEAPSEGGEVEEWDVGVAIEAKQGSEGKEEGG